MRPRARVGQGDGHLAVDSHLIYSRSGESADGSVLQRTPTNDERASANHFLAIHRGDEVARWSAYARILTASNEFIYLD